MAERATLVITSPSFCAHPQLMEEARALGVQIIANENGARLSGKDLGEFLKRSGAQVAVIGTERVDGDVLAHCETLKFIGKYGVGLDNLDFAACERYGVRVGFEAGVNKRSVTELALAFMLGHCRNVFTSHDLMRQGIWKKSGGVQLSNRTVGIIGLGNIGVDLAKILVTMGCKVLYHDIADRSAVAQSLGLQEATYEEILRSCDVITFHVPSTSLTKHMFASPQIEMCQTHALIVNTARGDIIDFAATCDAVKRRRLGGFATDVFPEEPFDARSLADIPNLYFSPHIGGNANEAVLAMGRAALHHIKNFLSAGGY